MADKRRSDPARAPRAVAEWIRLTLPPTLSEGMMPAMRVLLDDMPCDLEAASVSAAIAAVAAIVAGRGRIIVDVFVDGERWSGAGAELETGHHARAEELQFISSDPVELVEQTLDDSDAALREADALQRQAAQLIQCDDMPAALDSLGKAIHLWSQVQQAITDSAAFMGITLDALEVRGASIASVIARLNQRLLSMRTALSAKDPITLSDTLLYEMPEVVEEWQGVLEALRERSASAAAEHRGPASGHERPAAR